MHKNPFVAASLLFLAVLAPRSAVAQGEVFQRLPVIAGEQDDLARLGRLDGTDSLRPQTLRAPSRLLPWERRPKLIRALAPALFIGHNSGLAQGFNDGALWQGRGANVRLLAGALAQWGPIRVIAAPELLLSENASYQVIPYPQVASTTRSIWANPFHREPAGIDLPLRHGEARIRRVDAGQSSVTVRHREVELGVATENSWWGPGVQNAILLSAQSGGVPSAFVRSAAPVPTRTGLWDVWLTVGELRESAFFDRVDTNDVRTLSGLGATWRPGPASGIELGLARLVIATGPLSAAAAFHPFLSVGRPNTTDSLDTGDRDQITSLWARWAAPGSGFEGWAEWARFEEPASFRDLLEFPGHSQGYTLGLQWTRPFTSSRIRLWTEATYLEPSPSLRLRAVGTSYVSRSVPQAFTQRGQQLGPGIGPGSSSQWIVGDWIHSTWRVGAFASRVRWDNAALQTNVVPLDRREDVSLIGGLRAGGEWGPVRVLAEWAHTTRLSYLYQAYLTEFPKGTTDGIDIVNDALSLTISTPLRGAR